MSAKSTLTELERFKRLQAQLAVNQKRWVQKNKEKINTNSKNYYEKNKNNPDFLQRRSEIAKKSQQKRRQKLLEETTQSITISIEL